MEQEYIIKPLIDEVYSVEKIRDIHSHAFFEFFFAVDGELNIVTEKEKFLFNKKIVVVPPKFMHYSNFQQGGVFCIYAYPAYNGNGGGRFLDKLSKDTLTVKDLPDDLAFYVKEYENAGSTIKADALLKLIFIELENILFFESKKTSLSKEVKKYDYCKLIEEFIGKNYTCNSLSVQDLADNIYLSKKQTSRIIKKEYGCSFPELVNQKRLAAAAMLLKNTTLSINDIILEMNFATENYFYKIFKKKFGVTPLKYRKQAWGKSNNY